MQVVFVGSLFAARVMFRELLEPFLGRISQPVGFFLPERRAVYLAFALPLSLAVAVPVLGPLLFPTAYAASAAVVARYAEPQQVRELAARHSLRDVETT